jgi:hypothetical protein
MTKSKNLMGKMAGIASTLVFLVVSTVLTSDFWEEKPFSQWSEKEAHKILSDSPWGKMVHVALPAEDREIGARQDQNRSVPPSVNQPAAGRGIGGNGGNDSTRRDSTSAPGGPATAPGGPATAPGGPATAPGGYGGEVGNSWSAPFQVCWYSSVKVRQAIARLGQLQGSVPAEKLSDFVQQPADSYIVAVSGPLMKPFEQASLESLKGKTFLVSKADKNKKLALKDYIAPQSGKESLALFVFPRLAEAKTSLDRADEEVQFVSELSGLKLKTGFKLSKMMTDGKLDI